MKSSKSIQFSFILLLLFSTFMALAGIRGFIRLAPSIEHINEHNTRSLYYAEQMLSSMSIKKDIKSFEDALENEKSNITEVGEKELMNSIEKQYKAAFAADTQAEESVMDNIIKLSEINRCAMRNAGLEVKQLSSVTVWVIIFLTASIWVLGLAIIKTIERTVISPLNELLDVLESYRKGNRMRRCPKAAPSRDFQKIYDGINQLLDNASQ